MVFGIFRRAAHSGPFLFLSSCNQLHFVEKNISFIINHLFAMYIRCIFVGHARNRNHNHQGDNILCYIIPAFYRVVIKR